LPALSRARTLEDYGARGFLITVPVAVAAAFALQALLQATPLFHPVLEAAIGALGDLAKTLLLVKTRGQFSSTTYINTRPSIPGPET
jgi:hypothetical protein